MSCYRWAVQKMMEAMERGDMMAAQDYQQLSEMWKERENG